MKFTKVQNALSVTVIVEGSEIDITRSNIDETVCVHFVLMPLGKA